LETAHIGTGPATLTLIWPDSGFGTSDERHLIGLFRPQNQMKIRCIHIEVAQNCVPADVGKGRGEGCLSGTAFSTDH
jgi:hypothetical protein